MLGPACRSQAQEKGNPILRIFGFEGTRGRSGCAKAAAAALQTLRDGREEASLGGANWVVVVLGAGTKQKWSWPAGGTGAIEIQPGSQQGACPP